MKAAAVKYTVLSWVSGFAMAILLLMPFHAFLTVWLSSLVGHYTALRLWKEMLLAICMLGTVTLVAIDHKIRNHTLSRRLVWLIFAYMFLTLAWGLLTLNQHDVTAKALGYGLIVNLRYLAFFLVTWALALRVSRLKNNWWWLVYSPAIAVVAFGLLQILVLPDDFLRHFGYGLSTIPAVETINHNARYVRIASTLRGANPLGAYLLIPLSVVTVWMIRNERRNWRQALFLVAAAVVLIFTFSRSAWIGAALTIGTVLLMSHLSRWTGRLALIIVGCLVGLGIFAAVVLRHNVHFQNLVLHTQTHSAVSSTSDQGHSTALKTGLKDLSRHPLGAGPGTAGPASVYNNHSVRIAENYYIQIGQEVGWLGLGMFILINTGVGYLLFVRRDDTLARSLFASLIGLSFIGLLSHVWTDDTVAYIWWGLAGIAVARLPQAEPKSQEHASPS